MKSKLFLIISVLVVALMSTTLASAQARGEKVFLPCYMSEGWSTNTGLLYEKVETKNNTGGWLAQGRTIYYQLTGYSVATHQPYVHKIEEKVLDAMLPDGGLVTLGELHFKYSEFSGPWTCKVWYLK